jgi:hypothetical protein
MSSAMIQIPDIFVYQMKDGRVDIVLASSVELARVKVASKFGRLPSKGSWRRLTNNDYVEAYARERMHWPGKVTVTYNVSISTSPAGSIDDSWSFVDFDIAYLTYWIQTNLGRRVGIKFTTKIDAHIYHKDDCLIMPLASITEGRSNIKK